MQCSTIPAAALVTVIVCAGCAQHHAATADERAQIMPVLEAQIGSRSWTTTQPTDVRPPRWELKELWVGKRDAVAEYYDSSGQFFRAPMRAELERQNGEWRVTRIKNEWPWWWEAMNQTVGVK